MTPDRDLAGLRFDADGLIPAICQDGASGEVLLLAYMNPLALQRTLATGEVHFWSRSRQALWRKGERSGHTLRVERIAVNCEASSLLLTVTLQGPGACHDGYRSCYYRALLPDGTLIAIAARTFDPGKVYAIDDTAHTTDLPALLAELYHGYERLRTADFTARSQTARLLRDPAATPAPFLARAHEELAELEGVLAGTHVHAGGRDDVVLEASQVGYWLCLAAVVARYTYSDWQPHVALLAAWGSETEALPPQRRDEAVTVTPTLDALQSALTRLGQLLARAGVHPAEPVAHDLASLKQRLADMEIQTT